MAETTRGPRCIVSRGPNWLFVKVHPPKKQKAGEVGLAEELWDICSRHFTYRVVVEMDALTSLAETDATELGELEERLKAQGGALRICGLSTDCQQTLKGFHFGDRLKNHANREKAVWGGEAVGAEPLADTRLHPVH